MKDLGGKRDIKKTAQAQRNLKLEFHRQLFVETRNKTNKMIVRAKRKHLRENTFNKGQTVKKFLKK